jgi:hypothetical protein
MMLKDFVEMEMVSYLDGEMKFSTKITETVNIVDFRLTQAFQVVLVSLNPRPRLVVST